MKTMKRSEYPTAPLRWELMRAEPLFPIQLTGGRETFPGQS
jgi:hypothetical protein